MRVLIVTFALLCALVAGAVAQQTNSSNDEPKEREDQEHETGGQDCRRKKPSQPEKATEPTPPTEEQKPAAPKPGTDKDKEEFDVSEVPPVVTHHQITAGRQAAEVHRHHGTASHQARRRQDRSRDVFRGLHARRSGRGQASADLCLQRRPGFGDDLAAHGSAGSAAGRRCSPTACCRPRPIALRTTLTRCSTRAMSCSWTRCQPASAAPPTRSCPRNSWASKATSKPSANSSACISRATSAGVRRCSSSARATEPRARRASRAISRIRAFRSTASPCSRPRSAFRPWRTPRATTSLTFC